MHTGNKPARIDPAIETMAREFLENADSDYSPLEPIAIPDLPSDLESPLEQAIALVEAASIIGKHVDKIDKRGNERICKWADFAAGLAGRFPLDGLNQQIYAVSVALDNLKMSESWESAKDNARKLLCESVSLRRLTFVALGHAKKVLVDNPEAELADDNQWEPPSGYVGLNSICGRDGIPGDERYRKDGKNPARSTIQGWRERDNPHFERAPDSGELYFEEKWVMSSIKTWNPRKMRNQ